VGLAPNLKRGPANESIQVAVVGGIWGFGDKTDGTVFGRFPNYIPSVYTIPLALMPHD
jgi:hypothetical protein